MSTVADYCKASNGSLRRGSRLTGPSGETYLLAVVDYVDEPRPNGAFVMSIVDINSGFHWGRTFVAMDYNNVTPKEANAIDGADQLTIK